jgi:hypothetical protein
VADYSLVGDLGSSIGLKAPDGWMSGPSVTDDKKMWPQLIAAAGTIGAKAVQTPAPGPSSAFQTSPYEWMFDSSGWNVNFGEGTITSQATKTQSDPLGLAGLTSGLSMNWQSVALIGLGVVAVWAIVRR